MRLPQSMIGKNLFARTFFRRTLAPSLVIGRAGETRDVAAPGERDRAQRRVGFAAAPERGELRVTHERTCKLDQPGVRRRLAQEIAARAATAGGADGHARMDSVMQFFTAYPPISTSVTPILADSRPARSPSDWRSR